MLKRCLRSLFAWLQRGTDCTRYSFIGWQQRIMHSCVVFFFKSRLLRGRGMFLLRHPSVAGVATGWSRGLNELNVGVCMLPASTLKSRCGCKLSRMTTAPTAFVELFGSTPLGGAASSILPPSPLTAFVGKTSVLVNRSVTNDVQLVISSSILCLTASNTTLDPSKCPMRWNRHLILLRQTVSDSVLPLLQLLLATHGAVGNDRGADRC